MIQFDERDILMGERTDDSRFTKKNYELVACINIGWNIHK